MTKILIKLVIIGILCKELVKVFPVFHPVSLKVNVKVTPLESKTSRYSTKHSFKYNEKTDASQYFNENTIKNSDKPRFIIYISAFFILVSDSKVSIILAMNNPQNELFLQNHFSDPKLKEILLLLPSYHLRVKHPVSCFACHEFIS